MGVYTVTAVGDNVREWSTRNGAAMKSYRVTLRNQDGREKENVEVSRSASAPVPKAGDELQGEVKQTDYGPKLQEPRQMGGGGGGRAKSPEERRSIAAQSSAQRGVEIVRLALDAGVFKPSALDEVTEAVLSAAHRVYERVLRAERGES